MVSRHAFRPLEEAGVRSLLRSAGLELVRWLDRPGWLLAVKHA
jgi:hypothetical protein